MSKIELNDIVQINDDRFVNGLRGEVTAIKYNKCEVYIKGEPAMIDKENLTKLNCLDPEIMGFRNGSGVSEIVGDKNYFESKKDFVERTNREYLHIRDESFTEDEVIEDYCKWYNKPFEQTDVVPLEVFKKGCYSFAEKDDKESFEVYVIPIQ